MAAKRRWEPDERILRPSLSLGKMLPWNEIPPADRLFYAMLRIALGRPTYPFETALVVDFHAKDLATKHRLIGPFWAEWLALSTPPLPKSINRDVGRISNPDDERLKKPELIAVRFGADETRQALYRTVKNSGTGDRGFMYIAGTGAMFGESAIFPS